MKKRLNFVFGLDLHMDRLPPFLERIRTEKSEIYLAEWLCDIYVEIAAASLPAIKFQSSFFESMGWEGLKTMERFLKRSKEKGLLTIWDAKRSDIASTMAAYGKTGFENLSVDSMTIVPYMGTDSLKALIPWLKRGRGVYVVWLSSNGQKNILQNSLCEDGQPISCHLLEQIIDFKYREGVEASIGLVLGATRLCELNEQLLEKVCEFPLLLPGMGEQGGYLGQEVLSAMNKERGSYLFPLSRYLTGIGSVLLFEKTTEIQSTNDYFRFVHERVQSLCCEFSHSLNP